MKLFGDLLLPMLLFAFFIGCSWGKQANGRINPPHDFAVEYEWREGSLPPPYHYEYTVTIKPSGQSEIVLIPDYPSTAVPKWAENFKVEEKKLNDLYRVMVESGLFTRTWRQTDEPPVGGSNQTLIVTAHGKRITVGDYLVSEQQASAKAMYAGVQALVPKDIWERLEVRRKQYMLEHPRS